MARTSTTGENRAISGVFAASAPTASATSTWISLHTGDPLLTGANEYAGVTRLQFPAGTASGGVVSNTAALTFTTSGATPVTHVGIWDAVTAGNYLVGAALGSPVTAASITVAIGQASFSAT
jgi:hypothetical protein